MRKIFYKIELKYSNGELLPVVIAANDPNRIPELVDANKLIYSRPGKSVEGFNFIEVRYTLDMPDQTYEEELMHADIVDEDVRMESHVPVNQFAVPAGVRDPNYIAPKQTQPDVQPYNPSFFKVQM